MGSVTTILHNEQLQALESQVREWQKRAQAIRMDVTMARYEPAVIITTAGYEHAVEAEPASTLPDRLRLVLGQSSTQRHGYLCKLQAVD